MKRISMALLVIVFLCSLLTIGSEVKAATEVNFTGEELLGKPTDNSITINIVPDSTIEYYYEYGTSSGDYTAQTSNMTATGGEPHEVVISGLQANTQYYYRMLYHLPGETDWVERPEYSFWTQRAPGSTFKFTIVADSHAKYNTEYHNTIENVASDEPFTTESQPTEPQCEILRPNAAGDETNLTAKPGKGEANWESVNFGDLGY